MDARRKDDLEHLARLTRAGAVRAAAAFGQLLNAHVVAEPPVVFDRGAWSPSGAADARVDEGATGVFFEFEGCVDALVGILFPAEGSEWLVRSVVGIESGALDPTIVESALMEIGNILASHVASGIADALHSRLLPSIPALAQGRAESEFEAWIDRAAGRGAARIEARLVAAVGGLVGRLVIVPAGQADDGPGRVRHEKSGRRAARV